MGQGTVPCPSLGRYAYNALNLLQSFTREDGYSETYTYNANRLLSEIRTSEDLTTALIWDILYGDGVVISAAQNGQTTSYTYGLERISALTGNTRTEYVYDGRGSVAAEVSYNNAWYTFGGGLARKNVTAKSYTPFGEQIGEATSGFGYNGEYYNGATGMIYLRARFYAPEMNRFGQKDLVRGSVIDGISLNRYLYCQSDPVNFKDSNGRRMVNVNVADGGGSGKSNSGSARTTAAASTSSVKSASFYDYYLSHRNNNITATPSLPTITSRTSFPTSISSLSNQSATFYDYYLSHRKNTSFANPSLPVITPRTASPSNAAAQLSSFEKYVSNQSNSSFFPTRSLPAAHNITGGQGYSCGNGASTGKAFGTIAVGGELTAAFGLRASIGAQLVLDSRGHIGVLAYLGGGGGFPAAALTGTVTITSADRIEDLRGWGVVGGGAINVVGGEVTVGNCYGGATLSFGLSTPLPEAHGELTYTWVVDITEQLKRSGDYDVVYSGIMGAYLEGVR